MGVLWRLSAVLSLLALAIAGCGGGGGDESTAAAPVETTEAAVLSKEELVAQGNAICAEVNAAVGARARKIRADCLQGVEDKLPVLEEEVARRGITLEETAFVGNDVNDAGCLGAVGLPVVPADAWPEVVPLARLVLTRPGGYGCVREFCDAVWAAQREGA